jgi:hypothetical protein
LSIYDGEENRAVAVRGLAPSFADRLRKGFRPGPEHPVRQLLDGARVVQVPDLAESADPIARASFELAGSRTVLLVPLRKDDRLLGQIVLLRVRLRQLPNAADRGSTSRDRGRLPLKPIDRSTAANVAKGAIPDLFCRRGPRRGRHAPIAATPSVGARQPRRLAESGPWESSTLKAPRWERGNTIPILDRRRRPLLGRTRLRRSMSTVRGFTEIRVTMKLRTLGPVVK